MLAIVCGTVLPMVLDAMPAAYELDFKSLPAANNVPNYRFTVTIDLASGKTVPLPITIGTIAGPKEGADVFLAGLSNPLWEVKRDGNRVTVFAYDKDKVKKVTVTGDGPKPLVRRVLIEPPKKK
jgi:hypothetical protein